MRAFSRLRSFWRKWMQSPGEMDDEDVVAWYFEQNPDLKGCLGTSAEATQLILGAADRTEGLD